MCVTLKLPESERKRQDRFVRRAEKRVCPTKLTQRRGPIHPYSSVPACADEAWRPKHLIRRQNQANFLSNGRPLGQCRPREYQMRNFVILYRGREGSSPIINQLGRHPGIHVPVFEHLDFVQVEKRIGRVDPAQMVDGLFRGATIAEVDEAVLHHKTFVERAYPSIGFKWRIWGDPAKNIQVLKHHNALVFVLFRKNLLERAASLYLSTVVMPENEELQRLGLGAGAHPQFAFLKLSTEARAKAKAIIDGIEFTVPRDFVMESLEDSVKRKADVEKKLLKSMETAGMDIRHICYEDYVANSEDFISAVCAEIGVDTELARQTSTSFKRISGDNLTDQVTNFKELLTDPQIGAILDRYRAHYTARHCVGSA